MDGRRYALLIGNWEYQSSEFRKLVSPAHDVQGLRQVLLDPLIGRFCDVQILENKSEVTLRRSITAFFSGRSTDDLLLLYFSGHGIKDSAGSFYLTATDTDPNDLLGSGISAGFVHAAINGCRSRKKVLLIDSCFGGAFARGLTIKSGDRVTPDQIVGDAKGLVIISATDSLTYAFEQGEIIDRSTPSVFTKHLIYGLRSGEADLGQDGEVRIGELFTYVRDKVTSEVPSQTPKKWDIEDGGDLVIAQNANPSLISLPKHIQDAVDDWYPPTKLTAIGLLIDLSNKPPMKRAVIATLERLLADDSIRVQRRSIDALTSLGVPILHLPKRFSDEDEQDANSFSQATPNENSFESEGKAPEHNQRYALLFGCGNYKNPDFLKLSSPANDLRGLEAVLRDSSIGSFDQVDVLENKTAQEMRVALEDFFSGRAQSDLLLLYYSGHGIKDERGSYYFTLYDTDPNRLRATGVPASLIHDFLSNCRAQKKILLVDSSFSGAVVKGLGGEIKGLGILASADSSTYAFDAEPVAEMQLSVFTNFLITGLRTGAADLEQDGEVTIDELHQYVRGQVRKVNPDQNPMMWNFAAGDHDLVIARNPNLSLVNLPKEVQGTLENPVPAIRLTAIPLLTALVGKPRMRSCAVATLERLLDDDSRKIRDAAKGAFAQLAIPLPDLPPIDVVVRNETEPLATETRPTARPPVDKYSSEQEATPAGSHPDATFRVEDGPVAQSVVVDASPAVSASESTCEPPPVENGQVAKNPVGPVADGPRLPEHDSKKAAVATGPAADLSHGAVRSAEEKVTTPAIAPSVSQLSYKHRWRHQSATVPLKSATSTHAGEKAATPANKSHVSAILETQSPGPRPAAASVKSDVVEGEKNARAWWHWPDIATPVDEHSPWPDSAAGRVKLVGIVWTILAVVLFIVILGLTH